MKRICSLLLAVWMLVCGSICVKAADDAQSGTLRMLAYNVSGIPVVGGFQGSTYTTTRGRAEKIGQLLNGTAADLISTEEDFNGHKYLAAQMTDYPYRSATSGGVAQGQGLNVFSRYPLYNLQRVKWETEYGFLSGSTDALSNKGFVYCLMDLGDGLYLHVITVHMDAGYDILSVRARADNFRQLAAFINENLNDGRALIVQGDFNFKFKRRLQDDMYGNLLVPTGLRDVWAELYNNGGYDADAPDFVEDDAGDSLDRILYRSGTDLTLDPVSKTAPALTGDNGEIYSDHDPMLTELRYTRTGTLPAPETLTAPETENARALALREIGWSLLRVCELLLGVVEIPYLLVQAFDLLINGKMP